LDGRIGPVRAVRLSEVPKWRDVGVALLEEYLRLPDAWQGDVPDVLPGIYQAVVDGYPGEATPPGGDALLVEVADDVVAQVLLVPHTRGVGRFERMCVVERARGQGVGGFLIEKGLGLARSLGYRRVVLDVIAERDAALRLYGRYGFTPISAYADYGRPMVFLGRQI
jgi:GNAT superfamily N-acetyltransferase